MAHDAHQRDVRHTTAVALCSARHKPNGFVPIHAARLRSSQSWQYVTKGSLYRGFLIACIQSGQNNSDTVLEIRPRLLPYWIIPINHPVMILMFNNRVWATDSIVKQKLKMTCGAFSALQPVGRLYPCPNEFPSFISRGAMHHIGTRDLC